MSPVHSHNERAPYYLATPAPYSTSAFPGKLTIEIRRKMESVLLSLEKLLSQHFWVVPARTNRHDQWYKRKYQSWKQENEDLEPLILTSKISKEEWVPQLHALAANFAHAIRQQAEEREKLQSTWNPPPDQKLFADNVFDKDLTILGPVDSESPFLTPAMQRAAYWTVPLRQYRTAHCRAIKALLVTDQTNVLCHLARRKGMYFADAAYVRGSPPPGPFARPLIGWAGIIDETLELLMALVILKSHPESLPLQTAYQAWVPFAFDDSSWSGSVAAVRLKSIFPSSHGKAVTNHSLDDAIARCFRVLAASNCLSIACNASIVDWEGRVIDMFLFFVGFESWNRSREGQGYLGCDLNQKKDSAWLKKVTGLRPDVIEDSDTPKVNRKKSKDPLHLRDARKEAVVELSEEELDLQERLADAEAEEAMYGHKRSTKYQKRKG